MLSKSSARRFALLCEGLTTLGWVTFGMSAYGPRYWAVVAVVSWLLRAGLVIGAEELGIHGKRRELILGLLATGPKYGQELVDASDGELSRGSVYVVLNRMEERGLVDSWQENLPAGSGQSPRRLYRLAAQRKGG